MNHESFPNNDEQIPEQQTNQQDEFPTFEENLQLQFINRERINTAELTKPSLKNQKLEGGAVYRDSEVENLANKLGEGRKLEANDILAAVNKTLFLNGHDEDIKTFLTESGFERGKDFDVKLPGEIVLENGNIEKTPFSVSFDNGEDFTRIDLTKDERGNVVATSYSGNGEEGIDVGYRGPVSKDYQPKNRKSVTFN